MYPKTYARLLRIIDKEENWPYRKLYFGKCIYEYQVVLPIRSGRKLEVVNEFVNTKQIIQARYPRKSGRSKYYPSGIFKTYKYKVGKSWFENTIELQTTNPIGQIFKLFMRPQDAGRWSYRWLGR